MSTKEWMMNSEQQIIKNFGLVAETLHHKVQEMLQ